MKTSPIAVYAGSFDPLTRGHLDIIRRAARLFSYLWVAVANSPEKKGLLTAEQRILLIEQCLKGEEELRSVGVERCPGLVANFAAAKKAGHLVRGVRQGQDWTSESQMAAMNADLQAGLETVLFCTAPSLAHISSGLVRDIHFHGGPIEKFVPPSVASYLRGL